MYVIGDAIQRFPVPLLPLVEGLETETEDGRRIVDMGGTTALLMGYNPPLLFDLVSGSTTEAVLSGRNATGTTLSPDGSRAAAGDFDGDGTREAVIAGSSLAIACLPTNPARPTSTTLDIDTYERNRFRHAAVADVDGDGRLDGVLSTLDDLRIVNYSLSAVDFYPAPYPVRFALSVDLNTSGGHAVFGVGEDKIWQFSTRAQQADGFPVPLPNNADVALFPTANGKLGIVAADEAGRVFLYETGSTVIEEQLCRHATLRRGRTDRGVFSVRAMLQLAESGV